MTTTTETAPVIFTRDQAKASDLKLVELIDIKRAADTKLGYAMDSLRHTVGDRQTGWGRDRRWGLKPQEAFDKAVAIAATDETYIGRNAGEAVAKYTAALDTYKAAEAAVSKQSEEWHVHGMWTRFLAVVGGHIHDNEGCHTVRMTTLTYWLPELSGDTEADAVEAYGEVLCSHCYPTAPVAWQNGKLLTGPDGKPMTKAEQAAAQAAKDAEKAAKLAAKNAKALFVPGTDQLVQSPELEDMKTEIAVVRKLIEVLADNRPNRRCYRGEKTNWVKQADGTSVAVTVIDEKYPTYGEWATYAIAAIAAKNGKTVAEVKAEMDKKVKARNARAGRY
jgi:hypothetical protein